MKTKRVSRNIARFETENKKVKIACLSDIHFDSVHCNRDLLKIHLDYCVKNEIPVFINGDLFDLMAGRKDFRGSKGKIRPELNMDNYFDSVVKTAVEWFTPYAHIIKLISMGNHESSILKHQETNILQRFVDLINYKCDSKIITGGYGGWIYLNNSVGGCRQSVKIKYMHGVGKGGGIISKGAINLSRALMLYNADVFLMGHIHENSARTDCKEYLHCSKGGQEVRHKYIHSAILGCYKDEYKDGAEGWHIERGAPPKPLGGRILEVNFKRDQINKIKKSSVLVDSYNFPL